MSTFIIAARKPATRTQFYQGDYLPWTRLRSAAHRFNSKESAEDFINLAGLMGDGFSFTAEPTLLHKQR